MEYLSRLHMVLALFSLREDYWETFELQEEDVDFIYSYLLEVEVPQTPDDLVTALVENRLERERQAMERQRSEGLQIYLPKESYAIGQKVVFPLFEWKRGEVVDVREGHNPSLEPFRVIKVAFDDGEEREFAAELEQHLLNQPPEIAENNSLLNPRAIVATYGDLLVERLEAGLQAHPDFVRIAGRWFPRALLVDIHVGHLNLAEAVLEMAGGQPQPTTALLDQLELAKDVNPKLLEFSLDLALQEDPRFDEVGPVGEVLWTLKRLEPDGVQQTPVYLRYEPMEYDHSVLTEEMLKLEQELNDELSSIEVDEVPDEVTFSLIYPHWQAGTLPLSRRVRHLFPTAYEAPRIRFMLVDGETGKKFPGWVVRKEKYVFGLKEWYDAQGVIPGSLIRVQPGEKPGEVIVSVVGRRSGKEWLRTVLIGRDGGVVFALLKQTVKASFDDRMAVFVTDPEALSRQWEQAWLADRPFERIVVDILRELAKLNPQSHVHASELYAALNVVRRCPPGPLFALLASRPWFIHVGDLHFRLDDKVEI